MKSTESRTTLLLTLCLPLALSSACVGANCLESSTLVSTPSGLRPIGELEVGDLVLSIDPSTGSQVPNRISRVSAAWAWCEKLEVGEESLWLTAEHPVYSPELSEFVAARSWLEGELRQTLSATGATLWASPGGVLDQRPCRVIDLSVAGEPHTFIAAGIVVHNKSLSSPDCDVDEDCPEGFVCDPVEFCVPDPGTGGSGGSAGTGGMGGGGGA
jgi:hypothetical protein